jgi:hypothetical protein
MALKDKVPGLGDAIAAHTRALEAGNVAAAERHVADRAREAHRTIMSELKRKGALAQCRELALAKIGMQFMSKLRFEGGAESATLLNRWTQDEDGAWRIVACEDISAMRSPWSKIPDLADAGTERSDG